MEQQPIDPIAAKLAQLRGKPVPSEPKQPPTKTVAQKQATPDGSDPIAAKLAQMRGQQPPAETPPFLQAPPQQQAGGGAPSTASVTPQAQQPMPSAPATEPPQTANIPVFVPGTEFFATKSPLTQEQRANQPPPPVGVGQTVGSGDIRFRKISGEDPVKVEQLYTGRLKERFGMDVPEGKKAKDAYREMTSYYDDVLAGLDEGGLAKFRQAAEQNTAGLNRMAQEWTAERDALEAEARQFEQQVASMAPEQANAAIEQFNAQARARAAALEERKTALKDLERAMVRDLQMAALRQYDINKEKGSGLGVAALVGPEGVGRMTSGVTSFIIDGMAALMPKEFLSPEVASGSMTRDQAAKEIKRMMLEDIRRAPAEATRMALRSTIGFETTPEYYQDAAANGPFIAKAMIGLGESLPAMASPFMSGIFFQTTDAVGRELEDPEFDDIPELEKAGLKAAFGLPAMALERFGFRNLVGNSALTKRILASAVSKLPKGATPGQIQRVIDAETRSAATNFLVRMAGAGLSEAETGAAQEAADITTRELYNWLKEKEVLATPKTLVDAAYQIAEGAAMETAGAGVMGLLPAIRGAMRTGKVTAKMEGRQYQMLEGILTDPDYEQVLAKYSEDLVKSGKMKPEERDKIQEDLRVAKTIVEQIPQDLPVDKRKQAFDLILQKNELRKKDKALVGEKIAAIDQKLMELAGTQPKETAEGEAKPKPTATEEEIQAAITPTTPDPPQAPLSPDGGENWPMSDKERSGRVLAIEQGSAFKKMASTVRGLVGDNAKVSGSVQSVSDERYWAASGDVFHHKDGGFTFVGEGHVLKFDKDGNLLRDESTIPDKQLNAMAEKRAELEALRNQVSSIESSPLKTTKKVTNIIGDVVDVPLTERELAESRKKREEYLSKSRARIKELEQELAGEEMNQETQPTGEVEIAQTDGAPAATTTPTKENVIQELTDKKGRKTRVSPVVGRLTDKDGNNDYGEKVTFDVTRDGKKISGSGFVYNSVQEFLDAHPEVSEDVDINRLLDVDQDLGITRIVVTEHRFDSKTGKGGVSVNIITESGSMEQKLRATGPSPWSKQDGEAATPTTPTKENVIQERTDKKGRTTSIIPVVGMVVDRDGNEYGEKVTFDAIRDGKEITGSGFLYHSVQEFLDAHPEVSEEADIEQLRESDQDLGITGILVTEHRFDPKTGNGIVSVNVITELGQMERKLRATGPSPWSKQDGSAGWTIDSFAGAISRGQKLGSPEDQQFYENNKGEIERRLREMSAPPQNIPIQEGVPPTSEGGAGVAEGQVVAEGGQQPSQAFVPESLTKEPAPEAPKPATAVAEEPAAAPTTPPPAEPESPKEEERPMRATASIAPFYRLKIRDMADAERVVNTPAYKNFESTLNDLADAMGVKIDSIKPGIGKWGGIMEISAKIQFAPNQDFAKIREFAAIMGALAPESQDATIAGEYVKIGDERATGYAIRIPTNDIDAAISVAESSGLYGLDIDTESSEVIIFASDGKEVNQAKSLAEQLRLQGIGAGKFTAEPVFTEFIGEAKRADILRDVSNRLRGEGGRQQGGSRLRDLVKLAQERDAAFQRLKAYEPTREKYAELRNRQIELLEKGQDLSAIDKKRLESNRRRLTPAIEQQFGSWQNAYQDAKDEIAKVGDRIAEAFGGYNIPFNIKNIGRAAIKTLDWYMGYPTLLGDGARTTIIVDDIAKANDVFDRIKEEYYSPREENYTTDLGYPKRLLEVLTANGRLAEFQVMTPEAYLAKDGVELFPEANRNDITKRLNEIQSIIGASVPDGMGHLFYEIQRDPKVSSSLRDAAKEPSNLYYKAFMDPESMRGKGGELMKSIASFMDKFRSEKVNEENWAAMHWTKNQKLVDRFNKAYSETPPPPAEPKAPKEEGRPMRATAKRVIEQFPELEGVLTDDAVYYNRMPHKVSLDAAKAIVEQRGLENAARDIMEGADMPGAVRSMLGRVIMETYRKEGKLEQLADFSEKWFEGITNAAQAISALQTLYGDIYDKEAILFKAQKMVREQRIKQEKAAEQTTRKLIKGLREVNKEAINEALGKVSVKGRITNASTPKKQASEPRKPRYGEKNRIVTKSAYEAALREMRSQMFSAIIPPQLVVMTAYHIEAGARSFAEVAEQLTKDLGRKALPYLKEAYKQASKRLKSEGLEFEQTPDNEIDEYVWKRQAAKIVEKFDAAVKKGDAKAQREAIAALQEIAKEEGVWGEYKKYAADRLKRLSEQQIKKDVDADPYLMEFTRGLVANISQQIRDLDPDGKPSKKPARTSIEIIGDAFKNPEKYKEVWEETRKQFADELRGAKAELTKATESGDKERIAKAEARVAEREAKAEALDNYFGEFLPKPFSDALVAKAVSQGLKDLDIKIADIVRKHYTVQDGKKRDLIDKLVQDAGLDGAEAAELAKAVGEEFDRIATEKKRQIIAKAFPVGERKKPSFRSAEQSFLELTNAGAFSDAELIKRYAESMGFAKLTAEQISTMEGLADAIQRAPEGRPKWEAVQDLLDYQASIKGMTKWELAQSVWYANVLSGPETQAKNFIANFFKIAGEFTAAASNEAILKRDPKSARDLASALFWGLRKGWLEAGSVMRTGRSPIRSHKVEASATLERLADDPNKFISSMAKGLGKLKYVRRFMESVDTIFYEGAREMRAYQWAVRKARGNPNPSMTIREQALEYMNAGSAAIQQAQDQAAMEAQSLIDELNGELDKKAITKSDYDKRVKIVRLNERRRVFELVERGRSEDINEEASRFGSFATYNYVPNGTLGVFAGAINQALAKFPPLRLVIPFTNVISNVANDALDWTPIGAVRSRTKTGSIGASVVESMFDADRAKALAPKLSPEQLEQYKEDQLARAIIGTTAMAMIFMLTQPGDDDEEPALTITGNGYGDPRKNQQLRETGWQPYSIKIGDTWISYQYSPLIMAFGMIGHLRDAEKYRKKKIDDTAMSNVFAAMSYAPTTFFDLSFLSGLSKSLSAATDPRSEEKVKALGEWATRSAKSFVVPNLYTQAHRIYQSIADEPNKDVRDSLVGQLLKDVPFVRDMYPNAYNILGEPIVPYSTSLVSIENDDPVFSLFASKNWMQGLPATPPVYDPAQKKDRVMTPEERAVFYKERGEYIRKVVESNMEQLRKLEGERFDKAMRSITSKATKRAKGKIVLGADYEPE